MAPTWHHRSLRHRSRRHSELLLEHLESRDCPTNAPGSDIVWRTYDPATDIFRLHSNPSSTIKLVIDFDGYTTTGSSWNTSFNNGNPFTTPAFSWDSDRTTFSPAERQGIINIWRAVAEDFAPFNVDVTTEDPGDAALIRNGPNDTTYGSRSVLGPESWANPTGAGGIAFFNSFGSATDFMSFTFNGDRFPNSERVTAQTVSHETGHQLNLRHDGLASPSTTYYSGHGSGNTGWGPIMGAPFSQPVSQWSRGDYPNSNNTEDDLAIITANHLQYNQDDYASRTTDSNIITLNQIGSTTLTQTYGVIEQNTDADVFELFSGRGNLTVNVNQYMYEANLDILAELLDANGTVVASSNIVNELNATITFNVANRGKHYLRVSGTGKTAVAGDPGYSNYGSLGNYVITGTVPTFNFDPVAIADSAILDEDNAVTIDVVGNDTDRDGDSITITATSPPSNGVITVSPDGKSITYTPFANYFGTETFSYTVTDGQQDTTPSTASVSLTINSVNDAPEAIDDIAGLSEDQFTLFDVLANDSFLPDQNETLSIASFTLPSHGTLITFGSVFVYQPDTNFSGNDTFTYTISDGNGGSAIGTVTLSVTAVIDPPIAGGDQVTSSEDASVLIDVLANDRNGPDATTALTILNFEAPAYGTLAREGDQLRYTPKRDFFGTDTFLYRIVDSNGTIATAVVRIIIKEVNDPPVAKADYVVVRNTNSVLFDAMRNDSVTPDLDEFLSIRGFTQPSVGRVVLVDGKLRYIAAVGSSVKSTSFRYTVADSRGGTATTTVTLGLEQSNRPPVNTVPSKILVERNSATTLYGFNRITVSDPDAGESAMRTTVSVTSGKLFIGNAFGAKITGNSTGRVTLIGSQSTISRALASLVYITVPGARSATMTVTTNDQGSPARETTNTVPIQVVNRAPDRLASSLTFSTKVNTPVSASGGFGLARWFSDANSDDLSIVLVKRPAQGTVTVKADGSFTFTPAAKFKGRVSFQVAASDGLLRSEPLTVTIIVA